MKRFLIMLIIVLLGMGIATVAQVKAEDCKISFTFVVNDRFCTINLIDPLGKFQFKEELKIAPVLVNDDMFIPLWNFAELTGGKLCWVSKEKILLCYQEGKIKINLLLVDSDILIISNIKLISLGYITNNLCPEYFFNKNLGVAIISWPLSIQ